jgi:hypothetical protein
MTATMGAAGAQIAEAADLAPATADAQAAEAKADEERKRDAEARDAESWHPDTVLGWIAKRQPDGDPKIALMREVRADRIGFTGRKLGGGKRRRFDSDLFLDYPKATLKGDVIWDSPPSLGSPKPSMPVVVDVRFRRDEVLAVWPDAEAEAEQAKKEAEAQAESEAIERALEAAEQARQREQEAAEQADSAAAAMPAKHKHNGRDYRTDDAPLVKEMEGLIKARKARSPEDAARQVVGRAVGTNNEASKVARLAKHYRDQQS